MHTCNFQQRWTVIGRIVATWPLNDRLEAAHQTPTPFYQCILTVNAYFKVLAALATNPRLERCAVMELFFRLDSPGVLEGLVGNEAINEDVLEWLSRHPDPLMAQRLHFFRQKRDAWLTEGRPTGDEVPARSRRTGHWFDANPAPERRHQQHEPERS